MSLSVGIVGLPNAGKSTLFNALLKRQIAQVAEYPYTTIEPNVGVVEVPDERLETLAKMVAAENPKSEIRNPKSFDSAQDLRQIHNSNDQNSRNVDKAGWPSIVPAAIKFIDIAGLVKGAHQGEGLGNQFLGHIREVDAILNVVRAFENAKVTHVHNKIDPKEDIQDVNLELELADIKKPTIYVLNIDEKSITGTKSTTSIKGLKQDAQVVPICAKLEAEMSELSEDDQAAYLKELGVDKSGLDQVIQESYKLLDLITFFTIAGGKSVSAEASARSRMVQAWPIKKGSTMIDAAEKVHTDFARGFITAETVNWQKLADAGSWQAAKEKGLVHLAGRNEEIIDGMVVEFKFSV